MTLTLRRILVSGAAAVAAHALAGAAFRAVLAGPTRCPDRATGPASDARPRVPGEPGAVLATRGSRR